VPIELASTFAGFATAAAASTASLPETRQWSVREAGDVIRDVRWPCGCIKAVRRFAMQTTSRFSVHDPDGVPHEIVGLTWVFALGVAICSFAALTIGGVASALALALLLVPALVIALERRSRRQRGAKS
jgi:hypothetical protein